MRKTLVLMRLGISEWTRIILQFTQKPLFSENYDFNDLTKRAPQNQNFGSAQEKKAGSTADPLLSNSFYSYMFLWKTVITII